MRNSPLVRHAAVHAASFVGFAGLGRKIDDQQLEGIAGFGKLFTGVSLFLKWPL